MSSKRSSTNDPESALKEGSKQGYEAIPIVPTEKKSITRQIKDAFEKSSGPIEGTRTLCGIFWGTIGFSIVLVLQNLIPVIMIIIGQKYRGKENCKTEDLGLFILVGGLGFLARGAVDSYRQLRQRRSNETLNDALQNTLNVLSGLGSLFGFVWVIASWIIVYPLWKHVSYDEESEFYCQKTLTRFSFWIVTIPLIILGISLFVGCCCGLCFACCASLFRKAESKVSEKDNEPAKPEPAKVYN